MSSNSTRLRSFSFSESSRCGWRQRGQAACPAAALDFEQSEQSACPHERVRSEAPTSVWRQMGHVNWSDMGPAVRRPECVLPTDEGRCLTIRRVEVLRSEISPRFSSDRAEGDKDAVAADATLRLCV